MSWHAGRFSPPAARPVIELNHNLGYHLVRRGPLCGVAARVSLIKTLA